MEKFISLFLVLVMLFCPQTCHGSDVAAAQAVRSSSVAVQVDSPYGWRTIGSGTVIKSHGHYDVVTAKHVINHMNSYNYRVCATLRTSSCVSVDEYISDSGTETGSDWALVPLDSLPKGIKAAKVNMRPAKIGDNVYQHGYPRGIAMFSKGMVSARTFDSEGELFYWLTGFAHPGSSGGGVFDKKGRLIGIAVSVPLWPSTPFGPYMLPGLVEDLVHVTPVTGIDPLR